MARTPLLCCVCVSVCVWFTAFHFSYVTHTHTPLCVCGSGSPHHLRLVGCFSCSAMMFASSAAILTGTSCPSWCGGCRAKNTQLFLPPGAGNTSIISRQHAKTLRGTLRRLKLQCPLVAVCAGTWRFLPFGFFSSFFPSSETFLLKHWRCDSLTAPMKDRTAAGDYWIHPLNFHTKLTGVWKCFHHLGASETRKWLVQFFICGVQLISCDYLSVLDELLISFSDQMSQYLQGLPNMLLRAQNVTF